MEAGNRPRQQPAWAQPLWQFFRPFLSQAEKGAIVGLIEEMERLTTAEIHVHVAGSRGKQDVLEAAKEKFVQLGLYNTKGRNGVLVYICRPDRRFAVWGDEGAHAKAGQRLWDTAVGILGEHFSRRRYADGLLACVREVGLQLARHFPRQGPDSGTNDLTDEVSFS